MQLHNGINNCYTTTHNSWIKPIHFICHTHFKLKERKEIKIEQKRTTTTKKNARHEEKNIISRTLFVSLTEFKQQQQKFFISFFLAFIFFLYTLSPSASNFNETNLYFQLQVCEVSLCGLFAAVTMLLYMRLMLLHFYKLTHDWHLNTYMHTSHFSVHAFNGITQRKPQQQQQRKWIATK